VGWAEIAHLCAVLSDRVRGHQFDAVMAVARGGLIPAALVAQELGVRNVIVASVASYQGDRRGQTQFLEFPSAEQLRGRSILVVDDIWDSGRTLHAVRERAVACGAQVVVAVLHYKPARSAYPDERPDHWCLETDAWIAYPWERDT
jgi:hypothetical protein